MFRIAFERRLTFTIGRSATSGLKNVVIWNGILHKTSRESNGSPFAYPDPNYFRTVREQLKGMGIVEKKD
jgi:deltex-like protein